MPCHALACAPGAPARPLLTVRRPAPPPPCRPPLLQLGSKGYGDPLTFDNTYYKTLLQKPWEDKSNSMGEHIGGWRGGSVCVWCFCWGVLCVYEYAGRSMVVGINASKVWGGGVVLGCLRSMWWGGVQGCLRSFAGACGRAEQLPALQPLLGGS